MEQKQLVYAKLKEMNIDFQTIEHPAVYTIEEMKALDFPAHATIAKNLFLRNGNGKEHYLLVVEEEQEIDLKEVKTMIASSRLSFASEERLEKYLGLTKGAVSPFGLLNDKQSDVTVYVDSHLKEANVIGLHPNDNTATVFITFEQLLQFIKESNHEIHQLNFD